MVFPHIKKLTATRLVGNLTTEQDATFLVLPLERIVNPCEVAYLIQIKNNLVRWHIRYCHRSALDNSRTWQMIEYITRYRKESEMRWEVAHVFVGIKEI
jgi:hypothetical protein